MPYSDDEAAAFDDVEVVEEDVGADDLEEELADDTAQDNPTLNEFIEKYELNTESANLLYAVHTEVQEKLMGDFSPKSGAPYDRVFQSFCRSKAMKFFAKQWNLGSVATDMLFNASPEAQIDMMATFRPKRYTPGDDVNPLFIAFARRQVPRSDVGVRLARAVVRRESIGKPAGRDRNSISDFCRKWGLDRASKNALDAVSLDVAEKIIHDFLPNNVDAEHMDAKFMAFIRSRVPAAPVAAARVPERREAPQSGGKRDESVRDFARRWKLPHECSDALQEIPLGIRTSIMAEFRPHPDADVVKNFMGFLRSRSEQSSGHFIRRFDLDEMAQGYLMELEPHVRKEVMEVFAPKDSGNMNPVFMSFAKSVQRRMGGAGGTVVKAPQGRPSRREEHKIDEFCDRWGLDDECKRRLLSMPTDIQLAAMKDFDPKDTSSKNLSPLFTSFLNSRCRAIDTVGRREERRAAPYAREEPRSRPAARAEPPPPRRVGAPIGGGVRRREEDGERSEQMAVIQKFISKHHLNMKAAKILESIKADQQNLVMAHFDPDRKGDVSAQFIQCCDRKVKRSRDESPADRRVKTRRTDVDVRRR
eukprot:GEMP01010298.1.p1 GENE.GEMP01010298.1~~GEMP01010298.1.p1  ORF type:complete len:607 (+),score=152.07 GEMP01010298.1:60-1823(+)